MTSLKPVDPTNVETALSVSIVGRVQGIGYRPVLARLAKALGLKGWVVNTAQGVHVCVEGPSRQIESFVSTCAAACPIGGHVESLQTESVPYSHADSFQIIEGFRQGNLSTPVPLDRVVCQACRDEVADPHDRRFQYWLSSCSDCGPRYSIIDQMPYERSSSAMVDFDMCETCRGEYQQSSDRRFHAQTTCCPQCGPTLSGLDRAVDCLRSGGILGVKGLGGYQLMVDATAEASIRRLRERKGRLSKPLAVMVASLDDARKWASLRPCDEAELCGPAGPIVICPLERTGPGNEKLPHGITCGLNSLGILLPTTPLHVWLADQLSPLVVTSANLEGQPIVYRDHPAHDSPGPLADVWIDHNRPIRRPIDDSVVQHAGGKRTTIRAARGLAPLSLPLPARLLRHHVLAVGGHQKVAIAWCNGHQAILGPHLGDMDTTQSRHRFIAQVADGCTLSGCEPVAVAHDWHPDYFTTQWARDFADKRALRTIAVQHHHAHIASGILEVGWYDQPVLGIAWDGTGLGTGDRLWGGESLVASLDGFHRVVSLRPWRLPGGDIAITQPWRSAAAMLADVHAWDGACQRWHALPPDKRPLAQVILSDNLPGIWTTSMGRLFDAVAALVLSPKVAGQPVGYEGELAAMLESLCDRGADGHYRLPIRSMSAESTDVDYELDWRPLISDLVDDLSRETPRPTVAMRFHRTLARAAGEISRLFPELPVVLAGGVFQNRILLELISAELESTGVRLAVPSQIPLNDGGLAAGQLAIALAQWETTACV